MRKNKFQKKLMILNLRLGISSLLLKLTKLVGNSGIHLFSFSKKSTRFGSDMEQLCPTIDIFYGCCVLYGLEIYGKCHDESMGDLNVHLAIWRMFMYTTLQALISIGKEHDENSFESKKKFISSQITDSSTIGLQHYTRTKNLEKLFGEVKSQICELSDILGPRTPEIIGLKIMEYGLHGDR